jgi:hypothetical protein
MRRTDNQRRRTVMNKPFGFGMILLALAGCAEMPDDPEATPPTEQAQEPLFLQMNKQADVDLNLITRVMLARNHVVEFYEPTPGRSSCLRLPRCPTRRAACSRTSSACRRRRPTRR